MEADPALDSPTVAKVLNALLELKKSFSTPYLKRSKLPKTLTDSHIKKILDQVQAAEKQCSDVIGVAQHLGSQLQVRLAENADYRDQLATSLARIAEFERTAVPAAPTFSFPQVTQNSQELETLKLENDELSTRNESLKGEIAHLKSEIRRLRREFAQCDTPKDQLKRQFLEFGLPLELQSDIKTLESTNKRQADTIAALNIQITEVSQLCESLQIQLDATKHSLSAVYQDKIDLTDRLNQEILLKSTYEKLLNDTKFELMQEQFLRKRLNKELHGVEIAEAAVQTEKHDCEIETQTDLNCREMEVQTERNEVEVEAQTETDRKDVECQATVKVHQKAVFAKPEMKEMSTGEVTSFEEKEVQLDVHRAETREIAVEMTVECADKQTEKEEIVEEQNTQTETLTCDIGVGTEETKQTQVCVLEGCEVQGKRKKTEIEFAESVVVLGKRPQLSVEVVGTVEIQRETVKTQEDTAKTLENDSMPAQELTLATCEWVNYPAPQSQPALSEAPTRSTESFHLHTETWGCISPTLTTRQLGIDTVFTYAHLAAQKPELQLLSMFSVEIKAAQVQKSEAQCEAKPVLELVDAEKFDIRPKEGSVEWNSLSDELQALNEGEVEKPVLSLLSAGCVSILPTISPPSLSIDTPLTVSLQAVVSTPIMTFTQLDVIDIASKTLHNAAPILSVTTGLVCTLQPTTSVSTPSLTTQESEGDWGLETCGLISIYPEPKEMELELFNFTICDILVDTEPAEMTLISQSVLDLPGSEKHVPDLCISRLPEICDQRPVPVLKRPLQLIPQVHSVEVARQSKKPALSLDSPESLYVEGFNFRQLFLEAIEEEGKVDDGSRRRTRRRVVRKDPGEEYFIMVAAR